MQKEKMKQVAVRMSPRLHAAAIRVAKSEKVSFGEFVRCAVEDRLPCDELRRVFGRDKK